MANKLDLADAQILGFVSGSRGYSLIQLIESMGLKRAEWIKWKLNYPKVLTSREIQEIDEHFANQ